MLIIKHQCHICEFLSFFFLFLNESPTEIVFDNYEKMKLNFIFG